MTTSAVEMTAPAAIAIAITEDTLTADLMDGRTISVPLDWYPRLVYGVPEERDNWEIHAGGRHIHWPDLDEDISVEGLLTGRRSGESPRSLQRWLEAKQEGGGLTWYELRAADSNPRASS